MAAENRPHFDWGFNFGHVLTLGSILAAALIGYGVMSGAVSNLDTRLLRVEEAIQPTVTAAGVADRRLTWLENQTVMFNDAVIRIEALIGVLREQMAELRGAIPP